VLDITQSKASRHLRYLVNAGLLLDRRAATWVYYRVAPQPGAAAAGILSLLPGVLAGQSDPQLSRRLDRWRRQKSCGATCGATADIKRATPGRKQ
jgi:ArsR family transcriptional regulator